MHEFLPEILKTASQIVAGNDPVQLTCVIHGRPQTYTKAELQEMLDNPDMYDQADNLPVWVQRSLLGTDAVPKVPRERGKEYSNKAFDRAFALAMQKIKGWMESPKPVKISISERYPQGPSGIEHSWTRTLKEGGLVGDYKLAEGEYGTDEKNLVYCVHVQGSAVSPAYSYHGVNQKNAYEKLGEILQKLGLPYKASSFFSLGYDDISFEVPSGTNAKQACDALNKVLPKSPSGDYGYGSSLAASAQAYEVPEEYRDDPVERYTIPTEWTYGMDA